MKVIGSIRATAMDAERPGMEPNTMPIATPAIISRSDIGWHTLRKAEPINDSVFINTSYL